MARKTFKLNPPFREIEASDAEKPFWNRLTPKNEIDLSYLVEQNRNKTHVLVYEFEDKVLGFVVVSDNDDHFHIDLIENNERFEESKGKGYMLMILIEALSDIFGYSKITLHSTKDNIEYYRKIGYEIIGASSEDPKYGQLTPMEKTF